MSQLDLFCCPERSSSSKGKKGKTKKRGKKEGKKETKKKSKKKMTSKDSDIEDSDSDDDEEEESEVGNDGSDEKVGLYFLLHLQLSDVIYSTEFCSGISKWVSKVTVSVVLQKCISKVTPLK